ncbi:cytidylyltransferase family-domain-containing protein [Amylostereum chailletii]|nr:cytidylyltransferase family-domain-containing protein [Amylostereum chailletii]
MSRLRPSRQSTASFVASPTAFDLLTVDSGEEDEEEVSEPEPAPAPEPTKDVPVKLSKSAQKKAARLEKQQRKRGSASVTPESGASPAPPDSSSLPPDESFRNASGVDASFVVVENDKPAPVHDAAPSEPRTGHASNVLRAVQPEPEVSPLLSPLVLPIAPPTTEVPSAKPSVSTYAPPSVAAPIEKPVNGHVNPSPLQSTTVQDSESTKKKQAILTRTLWTFIMIGGFLGVLLMGHGPMILLVWLCQGLVYHEVTTLFTLTDTKKSDDEKDPWSKTLNWYFFAVTNYFLYGESIIYYFKHVVFAEAKLVPFVTNHRMISFTLYTLGFMGFVMSLKKGYLKQQFGLFCWVHMTLLLVVVSSHFIMNNILEGMIWFWVPASLVICNDVFAYIWGMSVGRTPLIKLSPKKTVEGFVGAFISTIVFAILWGTYFSRFNYMICPARNIGVNALGDIQCTPNPVFVWREWVIWQPVAVFLSTLLPGEIRTIPYTPYQIHLFFLACFASLVAPFGGFFASGFKRAFNIKDFGHSIPGHGGMTDRMDCQFLMGVFTYVYYTSLIRENHVTVGAVLQTIVSGLSTREQIELMVDLKGYLEGQGIALPF